jgi:cell division protein ZapD
MAPHRISPSDRATDDECFCFEQPLNERIRTFLRLEHLTARLRYRRPDNSVWGRRATMEALLDMLNVLARHDIRGEVSKELAQRRASLQRLTDQGNVNRRALEKVLADIDEISHALSATPRQFASYLLRDNELLNSLNNRHSIPGGSCSFDLPAYHHWLTQPADRVEDDIADWCRRIEPIESGVGTLLRLLRASPEARETRAEQGVLVYNTELGTQMIRVFVESADMYPEISAGRHRATIRFMQYRDAPLHVTQAQTTIAFRMACCRF